MRFAFAALLFVLAAAGCTPSAPSSAEQTASQQPPPDPNKTLVVAIRLEPSTLTTRPLRQAGVGLYLPSRAFNGQIALLDDQSQARPYLVESLPQLNTESWRVFPDGRMETTYRVRPNITWHDGERLTAEDFVFGWRVYSTPVLGHSGLPPYNAIDQVQALDPFTFVIHWKQSYPDTSFTAGLNVEFPPLPRHILESALQPDTIEPFANHPFWTREYVGLGPYKLDRWEAGAFLEGAAFDAHIWGRPKIGRIKLSFISDANTAMANVFSGEVQLTDGTSVGLPEVAILKRQWLPQSGGGIVLHPNQWRAANFQMRPDLATPQTTLDPRVRKALAHTVDKAILNETLYDEDGIPADSVVPPVSFWGPAAERGAVKYPYDPRRAEQLMAEAGFTRGSENQYANADGRFSFEVKTNGGTDNESEMSILASSWRQAGFDANEAVLPAALAQNPEARATFASMFTNSQNLGESALLGLTTSAIPRAENRWSGGNRGGWSNAEFDRVIELFTTTLGRSEREQQMTELVRIHTEDEPSIHLFFRAQPWVYASSVRGPKLVPPEANMSWNIHEWTLA